MKDLIGLKSQSISIVILGASARIYPQTVFGRGKQTKMEKNDNMAKWYAPYL